MDWIITIVVLGGFGYFIYTRIQKSKARKEARKGTGSVGGDDRAGPPKNLK